MELVKFGLWSSLTVLHEWTRILRVYVLFVAEVNNVWRWVELVLVN